MKKLTEAQYLALREQAHVEAADEFGDKVLRLTDGTYLKLFRIKRLVTSAWFFPYWKRFETNAGKLAALGIPTLEVIEVFSVPELQRTVVHYHPLPGDMMRNATFDASLVSQFGRFLRTLHDKGVYLRSLHLGNVILTPEGELGLIDFADMRIYGKALPRRLRIRNFHHLCRYTEDREKLAVYLDAFADAFDEPERTTVRKMFGAPIA